MYIVYNLFFGFLMLALAVIVFDWGRIWWAARHHGYITLDHRYTDDAWRWKHSYLGYKVWTWVVYLFTWAAVGWHCVLALSWFSDALFEVLSRGP